MQRSQYPAVTVFKLRLIFQTEKGLKLELYVCIRDKIELFFLCAATETCTEVTEKLFRASRKLTLT
jgi:hypothetical protein